MGGPIAGGTSVPWLRRGGLSCLKGVDGVCEEKGGANANQKRNKQHHVNPPFWVEQT